mmetsp:Transcript_20082/g.63078  ORF Transcript_20082/g.63078 Transcript_20082/m.63078 type:complete len:209 (+) Transcript_20082:780-1406(+)
MRPHGPCEVALRQPVAARDAVGLLSREGPRGRVVALEAGDDLRELRPETVQKLPRVGLWQHVGQNAEAVALQVLDPPGVLYGEGVVGRETLIPLLLPAGSHRRLQAGRHLSPPVVVLSGSSRCPLCYRCQLLTAERIARRIAAGGSDPALPWSHEHRQQLDRGRSHLRRRNLLDGWRCGRAVLRCRLDRCRILQNQLLQGRRDLHRIV